MGNFSNMAITESGRVLYADVQAGAVLVPTRIVLGSGTLPAGKTSATMTDVVSKVKELSINKRKRSNDGKATFGGVYSNADVTEDFYFRELALFCKAEYRDDSGAVTQEVDEVLYVYGNAGGTADYMPAYSTNTAVEKQIDIVVWVGNDTQADMTVESGIYMTQEQLDEALEDVWASISGTINNHVNDTTGNPHKVTAAQVNLGNVPNVSTNDQTPTFSVASALAELVSGEKLSVSFGKIACAVKNLISHIADKNNPHGVTCERIGAAATNHRSAGTDYGMANASYYGHAKITDDTASESGAGDGIAASPKFVKSVTGAMKYAGSSTVGGAADSAVKLSTARKVTVNLESESGADFDGSKAITPGVSGILPVTHGGTGASTAEAAREKLGVVSMEELPNLYIWKKYEVTETDSTNINNTVTSKQSSESDFKDVEYADEITVLDGVVSLVDPSTLSNPTIDSIVAIRGKYAKVAGSTDAIVFYYGEDTTFSTNTLYNVDYLFANKRTTVKAIRMALIASLKSGAYPTSGKYTDGYWYEYHKQLGE